jgi:hypothetical protein
MNLCALRVPGGLIWQNANRHGDFEKAIYQVFVSLAIQSPFDYPCTGSG